MYRVLKMRSIPVLKTMMSSCWYWPFTMVRGSWAMRSLTCACSVARAVYASILNLLSVSKPYTAMAGGMIVLKGDRKTRETLAIS